MSTLPDTIRNHADLAERARANVDSAIWDFLEGGAGEESSVSANRAAFDRWAFRPRILAGNTPPDLSTTFMGERLAIPVATAPFGADGLFHADGQVAVARGIEATGGLAIAPHVSTHPMEAIREAAPQAAAWFQLHPVGSHDNFRRLVARAEAAGFRGLVITADCPTAGYRDRVLARQFVYEDVMGGNYDHEWSSDEMFGQFRTMTQDVWTFDELGGLMAETELPFMVKGVMTAEDALRSEQIGASAVLVSNHGGRQLDCAPGTLDQLEEVVDAVGGRIGVALDGGIRRGTDVLKAIALGAELVIIGRLAAMGLAAGGAEGVARAVQMLTDEMTKTMALIGRSTLAELDHRAVQPVRQ
ncbi:alpha-hydroxy acid oxidase [Euzebya rosea]|uniref:alpha-hydroxy acid oxidase n=1 Tax=Euzebya rosea TaxID=2052804 RepID=UPI000D3E887D|nr:alpha-hydroxy acid oxidase [Euzebya rosea]